MKRLLLIPLLIFSLIALTGCIDDEEVTQIVLVNDGTSIRTVSLDEEVSFPLSQEEAQDIAMQTCGAYTDDAVGMVEKLSDEYGEYWSIIDDTDPCNAIVVKIYVSNIGDVECDFGHKTSDCNDCEDDTITCPDGTILRRVPPECGFPDCTEKEEVVCAQDVKECADGSSVNRIPPSCEFAACPENDNTNKEDDTSKKDTIDTGDKGDPLLLLSDMPEGYYEADRIINLNDDSDTPYSIMYGIWLESTSFGAVSQEITYYDAQIDAINALDKELDDSRDYDRPEKVMPVIGDLSSYFYEENSYYDYDLQEDVSTMRIDVYFRSGRSYVSLVWSGRAEDVTFEAMESLANKALERLEEAGY